MDYLGHLCRALYGNSALTQRELAEKLGVSLGKCHGLLHKARQQGYIEEGPQGHPLTAKGEALLEPMRVENAVLFAAGIDVRFISLTDTPKPLLEVRGQRLIERLIHQLHEAGIHDITVVVGYRAEQFDYLVDAFGVSLVYNAEFATKSNLASLYAVRDRLGNTYIVNADTWFETNPFQQFELESWFAGCHIQGSFDSWCIMADNKRQIRSLSLGGENAVMKRGPFYCGHTLAQNILCRISQSISAPGAMAQPWEFGVGPRMEEYEIYVKLLPEGDVWEFASLAQLRAFDQAFADGLEREHLEEIARLLHTQPTELSPVHWLKTKPDVHTLQFEWNNTLYVYRSPRPGAVRFTTGNQEAAVYHALRNTTFTDTLVALDSQTGAKIARFCEWAKVDDKAMLRREVDTLQRLHESGARVRHQFKIADRLRRYDALCRKTCCVRFEDFNDTVQAAEGALELIRLQEYAGVLCYMNPLGPGLLRRPDGELCYTVWEYAGMCHPMADIATLALRYDIGPEIADRLLDRYFERQPTEMERNIFYAYAAAVGLLWSLWGEYQQCIGNDFCGFAMRMYRSSKRYLTRLLQVQVFDNLPAK